MTTRMQQGIETLTEKEKQTLRLIVRGHDAKSIAASFDLSIHTINERLREARRKLAVSSSREAARLLLDAEGDPPKSLEDAIIGEAPPALAVGDDGNAGRRGRLRFLTIGGIVMSLLLGMIALATLQPATTARSGQEAAVESNDPAIVDTARRFLELGDQGNWTETYRMTGQQFRRLNSAETWAKASVRVRTPLGAVQSRTLLSEQRLPAPPGGYDVVKFRTRFANKAEAIETVTLEREAGGWKIVGITVG